MQHGPLELRRDSNDALRRERSSDATYRRGKVGHDRVSGWTEASTPWDMRYHDDRYLDECL